MFNSSSIKIEVMLDHELDEVLLCHREGLTHEFLQLNQIIQAKSIDADGEIIVKNVLKKMLQSGEGIIFVAKNGANIVGYSLATKRVFPGETPKICGYINGIYVRPHGRGHGLGKSLYTACEKWFVQNGILCIELYYMLNDPQAEGFWKSVGYTDIQRGAIKIL